MRVWKLWVSSYINLDLLYLFILLSICILYNKLVEVSKYFSGVCEPFQQIYQTEEGLMGTSNL